MSAIEGMEYSDTRINDDGDKEYYIDELDRWLTEEEVEEENEEVDYWKKDFPNEEGHDNN